MYAIVTELRNLLFRLNVLKSEQFEVPVISIGNLNVGGTGKTPHVIYIANLLQENNLKFAILSRGYGRKSNGFKWVEANSIAENVGDEPLEFKIQFPNSVVAVCEKRVIGVHKILTEQKVDVILLDDAFQHQYIKPSLNILLTAFDKPYFNDFILPIGNLRELRKNNNRADIVIATKCPENLNKDKQLNFAKHIDNQNIYFSSINYSKLNHIFNQNPITLKELDEKRIVLITGIANPTPLLDFLNQRGKVIKHIKFNDHHNYSKADINDILTQKNYDLIITTNKDAVKLDKWNEIKTLPLYSIQISAKIIEQSDRFNKAIIDHINTFKK